MRISEECIIVPTGGRQENLLSDLARGVRTQLGENRTPIRLAITSSSDRNINCELGVIDCLEPMPFDLSSIFDYRRRSAKNTVCFTAVLVVPKGIGAEIGGHAGDAGPVARLLSKACDLLITRPHVVNASDIMKFLRTRFTWKEAC